MIEESTVSREDAQIPTVQLRTPNATCAMIVRALSGDRPSPGGPSGGQRRHAPL